MKVGVHLAAKILSQKPRPLRDLYADILYHAAEAEDLGYDIFQSSEHHFEADAWSPSLMPLLAALAARTSTIRLSTNIFILPMHNPLRVSEDLATVDLISGGRVDFMVGSGSITEEFDGFGIDPKERWGRLFEALEIIRRSYAEEEFQHTGKYWQLPPLNQTTKPVQKPFPLYVGGQGPKLMHRAGTEGYHQAPGGGRGGFNPDYIAGLKESGRDPMDFNCQDFVVGHIGETRQAAWDETREAWWSRQWEYRKRDWIGSPSRVGGANKQASAVPPLPPIEDFANPPAPTDQMAPTLGNPDDFLRQLEARYASGEATHTCFTPWAAGAPGPREATSKALRLFAKEVMPTLKTWGREPVTPKA